MSEQTPSITETSNQEKSPRPREIVEWLRGLVPKFRSGASIEQCQDQIEAMLRDPRLIRFFLEPDVAQSIYNQKDVSKVQLMRLLYKHFPDYKKSGDANFANHMLLIARYLRRKVEKRFLEIEKKINQSKTVLVPDPTKKGRLLEREVREVRYNKNLLRRALLFNLELVQEYQEEKITKNQDSGLIISSEQFSELKKADTTENSDISIRISDDGMHFVFKIGSEYGYLPAIEGENLELGNKIFCVKSLPDGSGLTVGFLAKSTLEAEAKPTNSTPEERSTLDTYVNTLLELILSRLKNREVVQNEGDYLALLKKIFPKNLSLYSVSQIFLDESKISELRIDQEYKQSQESLQKFYSDLYRYVISWKSQARKNIQTITKEPIESSDILNKQFTQRIEAILSTSPRRINLDSSFLLPSNLNRYGIFRMLASLGIQNIEFNRINGGGLHLSENVNSLVIGIGTNSVTSADYQNLIILSLLKFIFKKFLEDPKFLRNIGEDLSYIKASLDKLEEFDILEKLINPKTNTPLERFLKLVASYFVPKEAHYPLNIIENVQLGTTPQKRFLTDGILNSLDLGELDALEKALKPLSDLISQYSPSDSQEIQEDPFNGQNWDTFVDVLMKLNIISNIDHLSFNYVKLIDLVINKEAFVKFLENLLTKRGWDPKKKDENLQHFIGRMLRVALESVNDQIEKVRIDIKNREGVEVDSQKRYLSLIANFRNQGFFGKIDNKGLFLSVLSRIYSYSETDKPRIKDDQNTKEITFYLGDRTITTRYDEKSGVFILLEKPVNTNFQPRLIIVDPNKDGGTLYYRNAGDLIQNIIVPSTKFNIDESSSEVRKLKDFRAIPVGERFLITISDSNEVDVIEISDNMPIKLGTFKYFVKIIDGKILLISSDRDTTNDRVGRFFGYSRDISERLKLDSISGFFDKSFFGRGWINFAHFANFLREFTDKGLSITNVEEDTDQYSPQIDNSCAIRRLKFTLSDSSQIYTEYFDFSNGGVFVITQVGKSPPPRKIIIDPAGNLVFAGYSDHEIHQTIRDKNQNVPKYKFEDLEKPRVENSIQQTLNLNGFEFRILPTQDFLVVMDRTRNLRFVNINNISNSGLQFSFGDFRFRVTRVQANILMIQNVEPRDYVELLGTMNAPINSTAFQNPEIAQKVAKALYLWFKGWGDSATNIFSIEIFLTEYTNLLGKISKADVLLEGGEPILVLTIGSLDVRLIQISNIVSVESISFSDSNVSLQNFNLIFLKLIDQKQKVDFLAYLAEGYFDIRDFVILINVLHKNNLDIESATYDSERKILTIKLNHQTEILIRYSPFLARFIVQESNSIVTVYGRAELESGSGQEFNYPEFSKNVEVMDDFLKTNSSSIPRNILEVLYRLRDSTEVLQNLGVVVAFLNSYKSIIEKSTGAEIRDNRLIFNLPRNRQLVLDLRNLQNLEINQTSRFLENKSIIVQIKDVLRGSYNTPKGIGGGGKTSIDDILSQNPVITKIFSLVGFLWNNFSISSKIIPEKDFRVTQTNGGITIHIPVNAKFEEVIATLEKEAYLNIIHNNDLFGIEEIDTFMEMLRIRYHPLNEVLPTLERSTLSNEEILAELLLRLRHDKGGLKKDIQASGSIFYTKDFTTLESIQQKIDKMLLLN